MSTEAREVITTIGALKRSWPVLTALASLAAAAIGYLDNRFGAQAADTRELREVVEQQIRADAKERTQLLERLCVDEYELVEAVADQVRYTAASAEPRAAKRAETGKTAEQRFREAARGWPCPLSTGEPAALEQERDRRERPLFKRAEAAH